MRHRFADVPLAVTVDVYHALVAESARRDLSAWFREEAEHGAAGRAEVLAALKTKAGASPGIGIVPITGMIGPSAWGVETSLERVTAEFGAMLQDDRIGTVLLWVDSPGGVVYGTPELAARIAAGREKKRIVAYTPGMMASAAYWIGSAAHEIVGAPSSQSGSIGVYTVHIDVSRLLENDGIHATLIKAGANKAEGSPFAPLSAEDEAAAQARIDDYYDQFVGAVAAHRGVPVSAVRQGYGTGRVLNARHALDARVIDRIASPEELMASLTSSQRLAGARAHVVHPIAVTATHSLGGVPVVTTTSGTNWIYVPSVTHEPFQPFTLHPAGTPAPAVPLQPADQARSAPVPDITDQDKLEAARQADLRALAKSHNKDLAWLDAAIENQTTVAQATDAIMTEYRERAALTSAIRASGAPATHVEVGDARETKKPWARFGEFIGAVIQAGTPGAGAIDPRLQPLAAASGMSQSVPQDGGFAVLPQFAQGIWDKLNGSPDSLIARTDNYTVTGESLIFNANAETSRATGSRYGGIQGYWVAEADQLTKSKPKLRQVRIEPQQMGVLVYLTDKLLRNAPALEQFVTRAAADEINFMCGDAIIRGSGSGQPKGILNCIANGGATIQVNKETSQPAATIQQENISKMWARLHPRSRANAVWLHNVDVEPQLDALSTVVKNVAQTENVGGYANKVFDAERRTLKGRPLIACEYCATLGTVGDLILADLSGYLTGTRGGMDSAVSMHVRFEFMEQALRFGYEIDGQPWLEKAQTPYQGTATQSHFVVLQTR